MSWLIALMAFASLMAILSTIVTTAVELVHKIFSTRSAGLRNMVAQIHELAIEPDELDSDGNLQARRQTPGSREFAAQIARQPTIKRRRFLGGVLDGMHGVTGDYFRPTFQHLSKLQFVEQLSQTKYGRDLSSKGEEEVRDTLERLSYEFDRAAAISTGLFRQRAKFMTSLIAIFVVALANINAIDIYTHLATSDKATKLVIDAGLGVSGDGTIVGVSDTRPAQPGMAAETTAELQGVIEQRLAGLELPIGRAYFPFCYSSTDRPAGAPLRDARCRGIEDGAFFKTRLLGEGATFAAWSDLLFWLACILATAGLLGLGGPFWFDLFRSVALLAKGRGIRGGGPATVAPEYVQRPERQERRRGEYPEDDPPLDVQVRVLRMTAGQGPETDPAEMAVGMRLSDSSAEQVAGYANAPREQASAQGARPEAREPEPPPRRFRKLPE